MQSWERVSWMMEARWQLLENWDVGGYGFGSGIHSEKGWGKWGRGKDC